MAKASAAIQQASCIELKDMIIQELVVSGGRVDYVEIVDQETLDGVEEMRVSVSLSDLCCCLVWNGQAPRQH